MTNILFFTDQWIAVFRVTIRKKRPVNLGGHCEDKLGTVQSEASFT